MAPVQRVRHAEVGSNIPASKIPGSGFTLSYPFTIDLSGSSVDAFFPSVQSRQNSIFFGLETETQMNFGPALAPLEAQSLDVKIDDGTSGNSTVVTTTAGNSDSIAPDCSTTTAAATAQYNTASGDTECVLIFIGRM
jgi:hypothetical protein